MRTNLILPVAVAVGVAVTSHARAEDMQKEPGWWFPGQFSGSASVTNNYDYRGVTQTDDDPAIQGSIGYGLETGFADTSIYASAWGSNVDFNDDDRAHVELNWNFGLTGAIRDIGLQWTLGGIYYHYPGAGNYNFWEVASALMYPVNWVIFRVALNYSPDFFNGSGEEWYPHGGVRVNIPIPDNWFTLALDAYTGYIWVDDNTRFGISDYQDWKMGIVVGIKNIAFSAYYTDTDVRKRNCGGTNNCDARAVFALTASF